VITVDVTPLEIGQTIHLGEIPVPPGVEILGDKKIPVISVAAPVTEEQEAAETAAMAEAPLEPEVLREKKEEGEEGEGDVKPAGAKPAGKAGAKAEEKPTEKGAEKGAEKKADKGAEKKPEKKAEKKK
jgi:hypothetical protein